MSAGEPRLGDAPERREPRLGDAPERGRTSPSSPGDFVEPAPSTTRPPDRSYPVGEPRPQLEEDTMDETRETPSAPESGPATARGQFAGAAPHADELLRDHLTKTHSLAIDAAKFHERELYRARAVVDSCEAAMSSLNESEKKAAETERVHSMAAEPVRAEH